MLSESMLNLSRQNKSQNQITVCVYARMALTWRKFKAIFQKNKVFTSHSKKDHYTEANLTDRYGVGGGDQTLNIQENPTIKNSAFCDLGFHFF